MKCAECLWCDIENVQARTVVEDDSAPGGKVVRTMHYCRVGAPEADSPGGRGKWPMVMDDDLCGEFVSRTHREDAQRREWLLKIVKDARLVALSNPAECFRILGGDVSLLDDRLQAMVSQPEPNLKCEECGINQKEYEDDDLCPWCTEKRRNEQGA